MKCIFSQNESSRTALRFIQKDTHQSDILTSPPTIVLSCWFCGLNAGTPAPAGGIPRAACLCLSLHAFTAIVKTTFITFKPEVGSMLLTRPFPNSLNASLMCAKVDCWEYSSCCSSTEIIIEPMYLSKTWTDCASRQLLWQPARLESKYELHMHRTYSPIWWSWRQRPSASWSQMDSLGAVVLPLQQLPLQDLPLPLPWWRWCSRCPWSDKRHHWHHGWRRWCLNGHNLCRHHHCPPSICIIVSSEDLSIVKNHNNRKRCHVRHTLTVTDIGHLCPTSNGSDRHQTSVTDIWQVHYRLMACKGHLQKIVSNVHAMV